MQEQVDAAVEQLFEFVTRLLADLLEPAPAPAKENCPLARARNGDDLLNPASVSMRVVSSFRERQVWPSRNA
jgi:hypothetical protein